MRRLGLDVQCPVPMADLAFNDLMSAKANGYGNVDWGAGVALSVRSRAGLLKEKRE